MDLHAGWRWNRAPGENTLATRGKITWDLPEDWKTCIPFDGFLSRGYWIRLRVSADLAPETSIAECRLLSIPDPLVKHNFVETLGNRLTLGGRPDAPDQVDISRPLEEYGFCGPLSASYRIGGQDSIQSVTSAWNGLLIGKPTEWSQIKKQNDGFSVETVEAARHTPINAACIVKAPVSGFDDGNRYGLYFINRYGAFVSHRIARRFNLEHFQKQIRIRRRKLVESRCDASPGSGQSPPLLRGILAQEKLDHLGHTYDPESRDEMFAQHGSHSLRPVLQDLASAICVIRGLARRRL